ncbi:MAG: tetratricopeptide repeat protein, partial [Planctomycetes bacterium]|nr:tetratricopeptide repeat protein [Planctomycetota bacterium]
KYANADKVLYELAWAYKSSGDDAKQADAIANFAKLASGYPDSSLAAEANFHVGESHYEKREFEEAAKAYAAAKAKNPAKDIGEKAVYKLGWSHYQLEQYDAALADFTEQLGSFPQGPLKTDALFMKAECLYGLENYAEALPAYKATQGIELSSPTISVLALLHGGQSASQLKQWDEALALLAQIPEKHAESPYVPEACYELGWAKQNSGKEDEAMKDYEQAADKSRGAVGARARFMIGELHFTRKKYVDAIREFQRTMYGYGGDKALPEVKKWQAKSGYEAGRCADVQIQGAAPPARPGLIADAKKYYQYVVDKHPQDELAAQAKTRLTELSKL